jgi:hypothetical protein
MWREYEERERQHFAKWTAIAFVPPLLSLLGGMLMLGTGANGEGTPSVVKRRAMFLERAKPH